MAHNFSTSGAQTAGVLLKTIPEAQQSVIARELTVRLRSSFDEAAASVAVELVGGRNDATLKEELLQVLTTRIEQGSPESVASLLDQSSDLSSQLVTKAAKYLAEPASQKPAESLGPDAAETADGNEDTLSDVALQWLRFAKIAAPTGRTESQEDALFRSALVFLHHPNKSTALAARDLVFSLFSSSSAAQRDLNDVRATVSSLINTQDAKLQQTLGYALWMRLLAASDDLDLSAIDLVGDGYWEPLVSGLRHGDAERRKMCLDILKRSVALAVEQGKLNAVTNKGTEYCPVFYSYRKESQLVNNVVQTSTNEQSASPNTISYQYSRYCAVFETLVLARYANLVVECERDLNLLASADSVIQSKWLYALLATALAPQTQDQNRKFIGDWILRSDLFSSRFPEGLADFVSEAFLPWAMEGHLFVSSTKLHGRNLSCRHGDRVATFVGSFINQTDAYGRGALIDALLGFLTRKHATIFAYSAVHLIGGIRLAIEQTESLTLTKEQIESLLFVSGLRTLPELATDYLVIQCWSIYNLSESRSEATELSTIAQSRLERLKAAAEYHTQTLSSSHSGTAISPVDSQRDMKTNEAVKKCDDLLLLMSSATSQTNTQLQNSLEDIWSDLEYLEYPRALLIKVPLVFFNPSVFRAVLQNDESGLRDLVAATLPRILDLAQRRSFLLTPVMASIREAVLTTPEAASILDIEEPLLRVAQNPPEPGIDLRMEYATIPLLSTALNESEAFCREQYFGKGEGHGFAAYLDLISRLGSQRPEILQSLLESIIARWKRQKNPPPTMTAWKTTLQLEVVLLCFEQLTANMSRDVLDLLVKDFFYILALEPLPRFRYLMEWAIVRIQICHPDLRSQTLDMLTTKDHQSNPKFIASLMKMGVMLAKEQSGTEEFAQSLATIFVALSSSAKIVIRHEAQWAFPQLMDHARAKGWAAVQDNPAYVALDDYIRSLPRFGDPPAERIMGKFDPVSDHTMTNLVEGLWTDLDYTRPPYTTRQDFLDLHANDANLPATTSWPETCMPLGGSIPKPPRAEPEPTPTPSLLGPKQMTQDEAIALQTKGTAYLKTSLVEDSASTQTSKHDLLLVASLIENPYNLGGLSRVSEIFGAQAMYVRDPRIIAEKDFTSVSVSSHNHVDIMPLTVGDMSGWMAKKKSEGWTVVGIEQTDRSVLLGEAKAALPPKTILVLGSEREGMPAAVLGECDMLVEIPQIGVTRSLNVQTAAAIVLFEYGRQHRK